MQTVIRVEDISKKYTIRTAEKSAYSTIRDSFTEGVKNVLSRRAFKKNGTAEFWALQDISFEVEQGDRIGIIGRNGAGKSTLLKILSRIVTPTRGKFTIDGRLGSLLEVGTGFHPELSGRENIFLNGALLGMTKAEIKDKFDEIVDFAEVEKFLDTPVKRYSSGMYVRLAFAVAAHLEPEILIIDEVLAVGDAAFQKKCLGKMEDVSRQGRTILFVSHSMETVIRLCNKGVLLESGKMKSVGNADTVVKNYLKSDSGNPAYRNYKNNPNAPGNKAVRLLEVKIHNRDGEIKESYDVTKPIGITMEYEVLEAGQVFTHSFNFYNEEGLNIFNTHDTVSEMRTHRREKGVYAATMWIPANLLAEGVVSVGVAVLKIDPFEIYFHELDAVNFTVVDYVRGDSARGNYTLGFPGMVRPLCDWQTVKL